MSATIHNDIRIFNANQFLNSFTKNTYVGWSSSTPYVVGDTIIHNDYKYVATTSGTSGMIAPTHTSGIASDGGVSWCFVEVEQNTNYFKNNLYVAIGKPDEWESEPDPDIPVDSDATIYPNLANIISAKRLNTNNVTFGIIRYDWVGGMSVDQYDPDIETFQYTNPFYVYTDEGHIYKCLSNAGGALSTSQPTGTSVNQFVTADGYVWQYVGSVSAADGIMFQTNEYIPVRKILHNDLSPQWNVQQNAKPGSLSTILVTNGGSGYTNAVVGVEAPPAGGVLAQATATIVGGTITAIQLTVIGQGYTTTPTITITGNGQDAAAVAVLAPKDGHGSNILTELDARYVIINTRFDDTEGGYFPIDGSNTFRQVMLVVDPKRVNGDIAKNPRYIGPAHDDWDGSETSGKLELRLGTGTILYSENLSPITRTPGQIEDIKLVLKF